jgi:pimeloyl-ACP methyl ester carboxylesterase
MKYMSLLLALLLHVSVRAQSNIRAWYADGQVWIVWTIEQPIPRTVGVYASPTSFSSTNQATLIGRPYELDYLPTALKEQVDTFATYIIPDGNGGEYTLALNEGLFVFTPHQAGALYFAVVPWGETSVTKDDNITDSAVNFDYDPVGDPVECHRQVVMPSPFAAGYLCAAYYMWVDGRDNYRDSRPDFPVMANAAKNGMPGFFFISVPTDLDTTKPFPLTVWLHGGGGNSRQSLPGSRAEVNINPVHGMLLAHNDDMFGQRDTVMAKPENPTWHFGWRKNYNPFTEDNVPSSVDTIINYTQRRYLWIDHWLIRHFNIDPARIHINGHSMGSSGTTALAKSYPDHYASATAFNCGFGIHEDTPINALFGRPEDAFPTNLINRKGETVYFPQLYTLIDNTSPSRDLPVYRSYHGKNDDNGTNRWDAWVIENYTKADSMGHGMQLFWSERPHGIDMAPDFNDHWIIGTAPWLQTETDNVSFEEAQFASNISYPAFYNHRLDPNNNDPGDGTIGTGPNGTGDDWGTWGGWHRWENESIVDETDRWSVVAWLEGDAIFQHDQCPYNSLRSDVAIRRPQQFRPATGEVVNWRVEDASTQSLLQQGQSIVGADDLVSIPGIDIFAEFTTRVRIIIEKQNVSTHDVSSGAQIKMILFPNPSENTTTISLHASQKTSGTIRLVNSQGAAMHHQLVSLDGGENMIYIDDSESWPAGLYIVQLTTPLGLESAKWIKL